MIVAAETVKIDLWGQSLDDQAVAEALARLPRDVSVLDIGRNRCGALTARSVGRYLSVNRSLLELRLWGNYFGNDGIRDLSSALMQAEHPTLHTISLDGCRLGDEGMAQLALSLGRGCTSLRVLSLENNKIGPDGIAALCYSFTSGGASCHLENLSLRRNRIGDGGAVTLANLLALDSASCRVQILDASHNEIGSEGASALGQSMSSNTECHSMSLHGNLITVDGAMSMASPIVGNATLAKVTLTRAASVIRVQNVLKGDEPSLAGFDHEVDIAFVKALMAANEKGKSKGDMEGSGLSLPPLSAKVGGQGHDEALPMVYSPASSRAGMADWSEGSIVEAAGVAKEQRWPPLGLDFATGTAFMFEDSDMVEEQRRMKAEREEERRRKEEAERRRREQEEAEIAAAAGIATLTHAHARTHAHTHTHTHTHICTRVYMHSETHTFKHTNKHQTQSTQSPPSTQDCTRFYKHAYIRSTHPVVLRMSRGSGTKGRGGSEAKGGTGEEEEGGGGGEEGEGGRGACETDGCC